MSERVLVVAAIVLGIAGMAGVALLWGWLARSERWWLGRNGSE